MPPGLAASNDAEDVDPERWDELISSTQGAQPLSDQLLAPELPPARADDAYADIA